MEALIFFACLVFATIGIIGGLYAACSDTKPDRGTAHFRRERFWNIR